MRCRRCGRRLRRRRRGAGNLATTHYENFHVATWFLPKRIRPYFESIYAFSRVSDDLGDEVASPEIALRLLGEWREMLDECYDSAEGIAASGVCGAAADDR